MTVTVSFPVTREYLIAALAMATEEGRKWPRSRNGCLGILRDFFLSYGYQDLDECHEAYFVTKEQEGWDEAEEKATALVDRFFPELA
jgi:hypothetical protein